MSAATWLVVGGNSDIALAILRQIRPGDVSRLDLLGRNESELKRRSADLQGRLGCEVNSHIVDLLASHDVEALINDMEPPDVVLVAAGELMDTTDLEQAPERLQSTLRTNFEALVLTLERLAPRMAENKGGTIVILNSVAGIRGRPSNYVYGATKAGLTTFTQGFALRWQDAGLRVLNVLTGMVATKMTAGRPLPKALLASTDDIASSVHRAILRRRRTIYAPWYWRWIMLIIRFSPSVVVKRL